MSVHILFMPVIQNVSRVHTFSDFSAAQLPLNSGSSDDCGAGRAGRAGCDGSSCPEVVESKIEMGAGDGLKAGSSAISA